MQRRRKQPGRRQEPEPVRIEYMRCTNETVSYISWICLCGYGVVLATKLEVGSDGTSLIMLILHSCISTYDSMTTAERKLMQSVKMNAILFIVTLFALFRRFFLAHAFLLGSQLNMLVFLQKVRFLCLRAHQLEIMMSYLATVAFILSLQGHKV